MDVRTDEQKAKDCEKMLVALAEIRRPFEADIDTIITYINHGRRKITDTAATRGKKTGMEVFDDTALGAKNLLVDGMVGYMCSRSLRWFGFTLPGKLNFPRTSNMRAWSGKRMDEYPEVKEWLADCEDVMYQAFLRSNFYDVVTEFVSDGATAGTAHFLLEEDIGKGRIIFTVPHFRECYIAEDQYGMVDTNYRVYKLTLRQIVDKFGLGVMKKIDPGFENSYNANPHSDKEIIHAVYPRREYDSDRMDGRNKPIASLWIQRSPLALIEESGYEEMPSVTWRWRKNSDEWYGRGPAWDAIVSVIASQQMGKDNLDAGHKMVNPPMVGPADLRGMVQNVPGGWTWVSSMEKQMPKPMATGIQLPFGIDQQERIDKSIKEHFHVNFFLMLYQAAFNKVDLTATQVLGMQGEQAAVLGTRVGRLGSEGFDPTIDRTFETERRAGRMPDPPAILMQYSHGHIEIDYLGPLAQAQRRLSKSREIRAGIEVAAMIGTTFPESVDIVDGDETMRVGLESAGFPSKCILPDERVRDIRMMRSKRQQLMEQVEMATKVAKALPGAGKAVEPGSPLAGLAGGAGE